MTAKCMRGLLGEGHRATEKIKIGYGSSTYELDLCSKHASELDDAMWAWLRVARDLADENYFAGAWLSDRLRTATAEAPQLPVKFAVPVELPTPSRTELDVLRLRWHLTQHAVERLEERGPVYGFTLEDVLVAAERPERTQAGTNGATVHWRGNLKVVVEAEARSIVTVAGLDAVQEEVRSTA